MEQRVTPFQGEALIAPERSLPDAEVESGLPQQCQSAASSSRGCSSRCEPICRELAIARSSDHEHAARLADPVKRSARARRDIGMCEQIRRVHEASFGLYGSRQVWHPLRREGFDVAKRRIERLMRAMRLAGIRRGKKTVKTVSNPKAPCPLDRVNRGVSRGPAECPVGGRFHLENAPF